MATTASPMLDAICGGILFASAMISVGGPRNLRKAMKDQPRGTVIAALLVASAICLATAVYRVLF
jgi:hypothetical protein